MTTAANSPATGGEETDEAVELHKADIPRVDAVAGPATGLPFLIAKSLEEPDNADLLAKALEPDPDPQADQAGEVEAGEGEVAKADVPPIPEVPAAVVPDGDQPGSPAWEAADAANLQRATALLIELKARICAAGEREWAEYVAGAEQDSTDVWQLEDVTYAIDSLLAVVAKITVEEQAEAGQLDAGVMKAASAVVKALTSLGRPAEGTPTPEEATVADSPVEKAAEAAAPTPTEETTVEKAAETATPADSNSPEQPAAPAADQPEQPVAKSETPAEQPAEPAEQAAPADLADVLTKALTGDAFGSVLKSAVDGAVKAHIDPISEVVKGLSDRVAEVEKQPMPGGPLLRGAATNRPGGDMLLVVKGQGDTPEAEQAPADIDGVRKALEQISDPVERDTVGRALAKSLHPLAPQQ